MDETKIRMGWISVMAFVSLVGGCVVDRMSDSRAIAEMVKAGADPQSAACALVGWNRSPAVCAILAAQKK